MKRKTDINFVICCSPDAHCPSRQQLKYSDTFNEHEMKNDKEFTLILDSIDIVLFYYYYYYFLHIVNRLYLNTEYFTNT